VQSSNLVFCGWANQNAQKESNLLDTYEDYFLTLSDEQQVNIIEAEISENQN